MTAWLNFPELDTKPAQEQSAALAGFSTIGLGGGLGIRAERKRPGSHEANSLAGRFWHAGSGTTDCSAPHHGVEEWHMRGFAPGKQQHLSSSEIGTVIYNSDYGRVDDSLTGQERLVLNMTDTANEQSGYLQWLELRASGTYESVKKAAFKFDAPHTAHAKTFQDDVIGAIVRWLPGVSSVHFEEETDPDDGQRLPIVTIGASSTPEALLAAESSVFEELASKGRAQEWVKYAISYRFA